MTKTQLSYGIQSGATGVLKHQAMSIASIVTTAACLLLISVMFSLGMNIRTNMNEFQLSNVMLAIVDDALTEAEAVLIQPQIESVPGVAKVTFITREEAMNSFIEQLGEDVDTTFLEPAVFRDRFAVELVEPNASEELMEAVLSIEGIADIRVDDEVNRSFSLVYNTVTFIGVFMTVILLSIAIVIMVNTIKLTTLSRREEIAVMKMMGAYDSFVRLPFVCEGCIVGAAGALVAFFLSSALYILMAGMMAGSGVLSLIQFSPYFAMAGILLLLNLALGLVIGTVGSLVSVRKHLQV